MSEWKKIWNSRGITDNHIDLTLTSTEEGFSKLKELMGITVFKGNGVTFEDFSNQFKQNLREMMFSRDGQKQVTSFFEVGCGTGSYLWLINRWFADSPTKIVVGGGGLFRCFCRNSQASC